MRTAIVIPFCDGEAYIGRCLDAIWGNGSEFGRVYIVDNGDSSWTAPADRAGGNNLVVIRTEPRIGFARACNVGASAAIGDGAEVLVFLNQDTALAPDCLAQLLRVLVGNKTVGIVAPLTLTYDFRSIDSHFLKRYVGGCPELLLDALQQSVADAYWVDAVSGACIAMRTKTFLECGMFDSSYFMYCEDDDLCRRVRYMGQRVCIAPRARVAHDNRTLDFGPGDRKYAWYRQSKAVYELKNLDRPLVRSLLVVLKNAVLDYLHLAWALRFSRIGGYLAGDGRTLLELTRIHRARTAEMLLRQRSLTAS